MSKEYRCLCGRIFTTPNSYNGHKSHCKIHQTATYSPEHVAANEEMFKSTLAEARAVQIESTTTKRFVELQQWIDEQHTCEKCDKVMTEKYGSGRFCSKTCANSRKQTVESRLKTSNSMLATNSKKRAMGIVNSQHKAAVDRYNQSPTRCVICGNILPYEQRERKTCSQKCYQTQISLSTKHTLTILGKHVEGRHIVYKTTMENDPRYYIGVRKTELKEFDGYLGSGIIINRMIQKYGVEKFHRETLFEFTNSTDAYNKEKELLIEALKDPNCVNIATGGQGGKTH